ncbi:hypothetical protein LXL04_016887 [Taraxacum kok-saghyz]
MPVSWPSMETRIPVWANPSISVWISSIHEVTTDSDLPHEHTIVREEADEGWGRNRSKPSISQDESDGFWKDGSVADEAKGPPPNPKQQEGSKNSSNEPEDSWRTAKPQPRPAPRQTAPKRRAKGSKIVATTNQREKRYISAAAANRKAKKSKNAAVANRRAERSKNAAATNRRAKRSKNAAVSTRPNNKRSSPQKEGQKCQRKQQPQKTKTANI